MKKTFLKIVLNLLLMSAAVIGCEGGGGVIDSFIPNFINSYKDVDNPDVLFSFVTSGTSAEGTFTGRAENFNTAVGANFTGTFKNSYVTLKYIDGPRAPNTYTGNFNTTTTTPYKLTLKNGNDIINLESL